MSGSVVHIATHTEEGEIFMRCVEFPDLLVSAKTKEEAYGKIFHAAFTSLLDDVEQFEKGHIDPKVIKKHLMFMNNVVNTNENEDEVETFTINSKTQIYKLLMEYYDKVTPIFYSPKVTALIQEDNRLTSSTPLKIKMSVGEYQ